MRVISQDGTLDFPYELSTIRVYNEIISMGMCKDDSCRSIIARYSTEAKAIKAMEMLRETYIGMPNTIYMDIWNYINEDVYNKQMKPLINRYRKYLVPKAEDENRYIDCWCKRQAKNGERI